MTVRSAWLLPGGTAPGQTREDTRLAPLGTMLPDGELTTRGGVIPGGNPFAATGAGAMSLQIGIGRGTVQGTTAQGAYPLAVDAPEVVTFADGDALLGRVDTVVIRVYDKLFDTFGQNLARVEIVPGTPAGTPAAPTLAPACLPLWDVAVPAGTSAGVGGIDWNSALTDRRRYTAAVGAVIPRGTASEPGTYDGQYADIGGALMRWSVAAGQWQTYRAPKLVETTTSGASAQTGYTLLSFAARRVAGVCSFTLEAARTGAQIDANNAGNIADSPVALIPSGWRPASPVEAAISDGFGSGAALLGIDGDLRIRTWSANGAIAAGRTLRVSPCYVL
ncbi:hypothetical protein [Streptomyces nigrescens]|uniref:hypothetical protein n=1 Tax=Streptomyces nigrescens TaxID=1920 RepID=UPI0036930657